MIWWIVECLERTCVLALNWIESSGNDLIPALSALQLRGKQMGIVWGSAPSGSGVSCYLKQTSPSFLALTGCREKMYQQIGELSAALHCLNPLCGWDLFIHLHSGPLARKDPGWKWEHLGFPQKKLENATRKGNVWVSLLFFHLG